MAKAFPETNAVSAKRTITEIQVDFEGLKEERKMMDEKLFEYLEKEGLAPVRNRPDNFGITIQEAIKKWNCTETIARARLDDAVNKGKLKKEKMSDGGFRRFVYYRE